MNKEEKANIKELRKLYIMNKDDVNKFASSATEAYKDYPLFKYLTKGKQNKKVIRNIISASINSMKNKAVGFSTEEDANAIAIFVPPNYKGSKTIPFLLGGGFKLLFLTPPTIFLRLLKYENHAMKLKEKYTNHKCWYLYNVTVKPEYQQKGLSSKLLNPMFNYLDRIKEDCYLETHKEENVKYYEHFGFELLEKSTIPDTDIIQYSMLRKAKQEKEQNNE